VSTSAKEREMMKMLRSVLFIVLFFSPALCFADELELSPAMNMGFKYVKPSDKTITIQVEPMLFSLILKNSSNSAQSIYWESDAGPTKFLSFEMTDEKGATFIVKHKKIPARSAAVISSFLSPGANVTETLVMDPDEWENLPLLESGKVKKYRTRMIYDNGGHTIYSDYYTLVLDGI